MGRLLLAVVGIVLITAAALSSLVESSSKWKLSETCGRCWCKRYYGRLIANCTGRNFSSVPIIPNSTLIDVLLLDSNNLQELKNGSFYRFPNLVSLNLAHNRIASIEVGAFLKLQKLQNLDLTANRLKYFKSVFKRHIFKYLDRLKVLSLRYNADSTDTNQTYPDGALSALSSLEILRLDGLRNQTFGKGFSKMNSLTELSFNEGWCEIHNLFNNTFKHLKQISRLSLSNCQLEHIEAGTFSPFKSTLTNLDLSYNNKLGFSGVGVAAFGWQNSRLQILNISGIVPKYAICIKVMKSHVKYFVNTTIEELYCDDNRIEAFEIGALPLLPKTLRIASLKKSRFTLAKYYADLKSLTALKQIDLSGYRESAMFFKFQPGGVLTDSDCLLEDEPRCSALLNKRYTSYTAEATATMDAADTSHYNKRKSFFKDSAIIPDSKTSRVSPAISSIQHGLNSLIITLPPKLETIIVKYKQMSFSVTGVQIMKNELKTLDLSYNLLSSWYGPITGLEQLEILDLSNNLATRVAPSFFRNFNSLKRLNISWNLLNKVIVNDTEGALFENLTNLRVLDLSGNTLNKFSQKLFHGLPSLTTLYASNNYLYSVKVRVKHMRYLRKIDLSHNMLRWLSRDFIADLDYIAKTSSDDVKLDLSYNPISCECANLYFLTWMLNSKVKQHHRMRQYHCVDANRKNISLFRLERIVKSLRKSCSSDFGSTVGGTAFGFLLVFVVFGGLCYRHRWRLEFCYNWGRAEQNSEANMDFLYDCYVSFAPPDSEFYHTKILPHVQGKRFVSRDDVPSNKIGLNEIGELISQSRKTVLILSRNFEDDDMCEKEFEMAVHEKASTGRDVIVMILLEDMTQEMLPTEINRLAMTDSYLKYKESDGEQFWEKFRAAI